MPRAEWPLLNDQPVIQIVLTLAPGGNKSIRTLLADTGAGTSQSTFELLLDEQDCLLCGGKPAQSVGLGGAYVGSFPRYRLRVAIPQLNFTARVFVVGVPRTPGGMDGIACFRFLNRFSFGNFGNKHSFGLEA
jgi:hypothetical protein